jgi:hypothetical protein
MLSCNMSLRRLAIRVTGAHWRLIVHGLHPQMLRCIRIAASKVEDLSKWLREQLDRHEVLALLDMHNSSRTSTRNCTLPLSITVASASALAQCNSHTGNVGALPLKDFVLVLPGGKGAAARASACFRCCSGAITKACQRAMRL